MIDQMGPCCKIQITRTRGSWIPSWKTLQHLSHIFYYIIASGALRMMWNSKYWPFVGLNGIEPGDLTPKVILQLPGATVRQNTNGVVLAVAKNWQFRKGRMAVQIMKSLLFRESYSKIISKEQCLIQKTLLPVLRRHSQVHLNTCQYSFHSSALIYIQPNPHTTSDQGFFYKVQSSPLLDLTTLRLEADHIRNGSSHGWFGALVS